MRSVDTHCHLQMTQFDADREEVLARALEQLAFIIVIGDAVDGCLGALELVRPNVYATVGFHPYHAVQYDKDAENRLEEFASRPGVVAIGEIGLDYHNEVSPRPVQRRAFEQQLALAARLGLPAVIHSRDADEDTYAVLREQVPHLAACILHCFGGGVDFADKCLALGCFISFAGNVTFPKAITLQEAAKRVPLDRLLAETDAPYLAPQPVRGKRCEPGHVLHTLRFLADLKGQVPEDIQAQVVKNACKAFTIPLPV
jgi:TatD DNase family protein